MEKDQKLVELGAFLKSRRGRIRPEDVGLPVGVRRRTPRLRREEVAQLAGIGLTWYTWLEQGRDINVSDQVLSSLARVLRLSKTERGYLFSLAGKVVPDGGSLDYQTVSDHLRNLLDSLGAIPAYVIDRRWNVLAWNAAATAVFGDFSVLDVAERNIVWMMFNTDWYKELFDDWGFHAKGILTRFRTDFGMHMEDPQFQNLISRLQAASPAFNDWWAIHDIQGMSDVIKVMKHPAVGTLKLEFSSFSASDNRNMRLILHAPAPDSDTGRKLAKLLLSASRH